MKKWCVACIISCPPKSHIRTFTFFDEELIVPDPSLSIKEGAIIPWSNSTSKFISGLYKSVPPLSDLFNMAGMELPGYLGTETKKESIDEAQSEQE